MPLVLGSRSTYLRGRLGGLDGRALRKDDALRLLPSGPARPRRVAPARIPDYRSTRAEIRVVLGPQADRFTDDGIRALLDSPYEVLPQSDRMGARLSRAAHRARAGPRHHLRRHRARIRSRCPGDGQPIVLLVDRQSTGGYTKLATVCSCDIGRIGQARPGQSLRFRAVDVAEAHRLLRESDAVLGAAVREEIA